MKYLFVLENFAPDFEYGGVVRSVYDLADSLSLEHEIVIYTYMSELHSLIEVEMFDSTVNKNITIIRVGGGGASYYFQLMSLLNRHSFDYAYLPVVWSLSSFVCPLMFKIKKLKFLFSPHGSLDKVLFNWKTPVKFLYWKLFGRLSESLSSYVIVNSRYEADEGRFCKQSSQKLRIIPNIISSDGQVPDCQYANSEIRLLFFGRVSPKKQLELIVMALADFKRRGIFFKLDIFGKVEPSYYSKLDVIIRKLFLEADVSFKGHISRGEFVNNHLNVRYINLLPSLDENFAISVGELSLLGIPSVVSPYVGIGGFYDQKSIVVCKNEVDEICKGIESLRSEQRWQGYSENARAIAVSAFSKEKVASLFLSTTSDLGDK